MNRRALMVVVIFLLLGIIIVNEVPRSRHSEPFDLGPPPHYWEEKFLAKKTFQEAVQSISQDNLRKNLQYLASPELEGRMSGKEGNRKAAAFIKEQYESYGLPTTYHKFSIQRVNPGPKNETGDDFTQNIYAWVEGNELPNEIVVIGAHMDHVGYGPRYSMGGGGRIHPGADDNASGTVALMEIARAASMVKEQSKRTIVFQSYSAEEMGLIGSRFYANNPTFPQGNPDIKKHIAMVNMDMVGRLRRGGTFAFHSNSSPDIKELISELNKKYVFASNITSRGSGGSDHASFYNKRIPVAFLFTGMHGDYHRPGDTADKINYSGLEQVAKYGFELVWKISQGNSAPTFNHGAYIKMPMTHDHNKTPFNY